MCLQLGLGLGMLVLGNIQKKCLLGILIYFLGAPRKGGKLGQFQEPLKDKKAVLALVLTCDDRLTQKGHQQM